MTLLAGTELLLAIAAVYLAAVVRFAGDLSEENGTLLLARAAVFGVAVVVAMTAMGLYQSRQRLRIEGVVVRVGIGLGIAAVATAVTYQVATPLSLGRGWWFISLLLALAFLLASRTVFARVVDREFLRRRVLVYGAGKKAASLLQLRRRSDQRGFRITAFVPAPSDTETLQDDRIDRCSCSLLEVARKHGAEEIVVALDERRGSFPTEQLLACKAVGIEVVDILTFLERESGRVMIEFMRPSWMIFSRGFTRSSSRLAVSRMLDLVASLGLLVIALPLMLMTALAILLEDGRPILYRQTRVGLHGKEFELLKFRSMVKDAERGGARWAGANDSRVTAVGRVIRRIRIDELPQLFNILKGDMRFIGPRPERPEFVAELAKKIPYYLDRHCVKPGLTGWAQLSYPYGSSEKDAFEKLQYDLYYVKYQGLVFDLMILLQTVEVVLWRKGSR
jgi:sugar transferase (PEP-CTERM system associated)